MLVQAVMHHIPVQISAVRWTPPVGNSFKLNVDVAGQNSDEKWELAAVIRYTEGMVVAVKCCCILASQESDMAEGLDCLRDWNLQRICCF
ncbi:hypothetical protein MtrunA17_Chr1g0177111 [Medicago truncatula]|uniref:RNase H type-1 domain-containing protein n=1 Tax=Medicago truncatula TaxID=3880 RepID=I3SE41_MEDTR|nr:unknown [Medicago truncatula]RHN79415.1 hypothetical protein MtrunA17_Chr1g0177111 [Medicago truncatula]